MVIMVIDDGEDDEERDYCLKSYWGKTNTSNMHKCEIF